MLFYSAAANGVDVISTIGRGTYADKLTAWPYTSQFFTSLSDQVSTQFVYIMNTFKLMINMNFIVCLPEKIPRWQDAKRYLAKYTNFRICRDIKSCLSAGKLRVNMP